MIGAVLAGAQMVKGLVDSQKAKEDEKKALAHAKGVQGKKMDIANRMAGSTQAVGAAEAQANARQTQADTVGQAALQTDDPNKMAAVLANTNIQNLKAGKERDVAAQAQRDKGVSMQFNALDGETDIASAEMKMAQNKRTAGENVGGAGIGNIMSMGKDKRIMGMYDQIQKGTFDPSEGAFGKSSAWIQKLFGGNSVNIGTRKL